MKKALIEQILRETEIGYNLMAVKFSQTRKHFWRDLEFIANYAENGDRILDYGCGNGRLLDLLSAKVKLFQYMGLDISQKLVEIASAKYARENVEFQKINHSQAILPFEDDYFNVIYSIAVFSSSTLQKIAKGDSRRIVQSCQTRRYIIITVWNLWQKEYRGNILRNWKNKIIGQSELDRNDCYVSFTNNEGEVFKRYHHAFSQGELKKLFTQAGFRINKCGIINSRNIYLVGQK